VNVVLVMKEEVVSFLYFFTVVSHLVLELGSGLELDLSPSFCNLVSNSQTWT